MGNRTSCELKDEAIHDIHEETGFSRHQIGRLYSRFKSLAKNDSDLLSREDLLGIPEIAINPLGERIVNAFFPTGDGTASDTIDFSQFVRTLACFRPVKSHSTDEQLNSRLSKLKFAFKMYDINNDGKITREELLSLLNMMVGSNISQDQLASIADRTIVEADADTDGVISFQEFQQIMEKVDIEQRMSIRFLN
jgi:calcineurin B family protein 1